MAMTGAESRRRCCANRKATGTCLNCSAPAEPNRNSCAKHLAYDTARTKARYAKHRAEGLCVFCGKSTKAAMRLCEICTKSKARNDQRGSWRAKQNRLCRVCHLPAVAGRTRCPICAAKDIDYCRKIRNKRRAEGFCGCGSPLSEFIKMLGRKTCDDCLDYGMARKGGIAI